jgi:PAS domain S-box-containing protein
MSSEDRFRSTFEQIALGIAHVDVDSFRIVMLNDKFCSLLGYSRDELLGADSRVLTPADDVSVRDDERAQVIAGTLKSSTAERRLIRKDGKTRWFSHILSLVRDTTGRPRYFILVLEDIDARMQAENSLRESESRYRDIADAAGAYNWENDRDGRYSFVSKWSEKIFGYLPSEMIGRTPAEFMPPGESARVKALVAEKRLADGTVRALEHRSVTKSGQIFWQQISMIPMLDAAGNLVGNRGTGVDITERKHMESNLLSSKRLLEEVIDAIPMSIFAKDLESNYVMVNKHMADFFAMPRDRLLYRHTSQLPTRDATRTQSLNDDRWVFTNRKTLDHDTWIERPDGTPVAFHSTKIPLIDETGTLTGLLGINRDVTAEREAERKLSELNESLDLRVRKRTAELEQAIRELESFSYSVSHDLRAPLRSIIGFLSILNESGEEDTADERRGLMGRVIGSATRMSTLIDDVLEYSRVSRAEYRRVTVHLDREVSDIVSELRQQYPKTTFQISPLGEIKGDPVMLRQIFGNLLGNACKYSAMRDSPVVEVLCKDNGAACEFTVRDNGIGFDMAHAGHLFGLFRRMHSDGTIPGNGLGLAIVKRLVERQGGNIRADSRPGDGARFCFSVDRKKVD